MGSKNNNKNYESYKSKFPLDYLLLLIALALLVLGIVVFSILPSQVNVGQYRVPILTFLVTLVLTAVGNIVVGLIQTGVSRESAKALKEPIDDLTKSVEKLKLIQSFFDAGVVGIYPNRSSAMQEFRREIEREDTTIHFVGTSLLGTLDPFGESDDKRDLYKLLLQKMENGVRIRALLMHPAYGEFRERVENRERAAVARDIQCTLKYLSGTTSESSPTENTDNNFENDIPLLNKENIRLYPGVITAYSIFTSRSMLVNLSTLHGPVYDNFTIIIEDTPDPNSIFKKFKANHFEEPWKSEKSVTLADIDKDIIGTLLKIDFGNDDYRFNEGNWPPTIQKNS